VRGKSGCLLRRVVAEKGKVEAINAKATGKPQGVEENETWKYPVEVRRDALLLCGCEGGWWGGVVCGLVGGVWGFFVLWELI